MSDTLIGDPDGIYFKVIAHSISPDGVEVVTGEGQYQRFIHSEVMTHRKFSRNSASSRAIPLAKMIAKVRSNPAVPISFPAEQKGMQGGAELTGVRRRLAVAAWILASRVACVLAGLLGRLGVHKSIANRILEPFAWHKVIITATDWDGFFAQRCHPDAQPEIRRFAECAREAIEASEPVSLGHGQWHTPYVDREERAMMAAMLVMGQDKPDERQISSARCARVSYLTHDGQRSFPADVYLFERLATADPGHWSPMEHVCRPAKDFETVLGNLTGWVQYRHQLELAA